MIKVLNVLGGMNFGGIEMLLKNYSETINRNEFIYDFLTCEPEENATINAIKDTGSKVFYYTRKRISFSKNIIESLVFLFNNRKYYDIIHIHLNYEGIQFLIFALIFGYKVRIAHSHTSFIGQKIGRFVQVKCKLTKLLSNYHAGCSNESNLFLFSDTQKCDVIPNAIDYEKFSFSLKNRKKFRKELKLTDGEKAVVLVGRFNEEKNHKFICELVRDYKLSNMHIFFIGEGDMKDEIALQIKKMDLANFITILGSRNNISEILSAFDLCILPSIHEGFPMVLIEAQVNGMKCIVSENVPENVDISGNCVFIPLSKNVWSRTLNEIQCFNKRDFKGNQEFNIKNSILQLENLYKKCVEVKV